MLAQWYLSAAEQVDAGGILGREIHFYGILNSNRADAANERLS
ncbi:hypothetical protein FB99_45370 (plasmid) [Pantoea agglomerans]|nr:hypothetical protein FB99_45370 [Pantoea agglomerans]